MFMGGFWGSVWMSGQSQNERSPKPSKAEKLFLNLKFKPSLNTAGWNAWESSLFPPTYSHDHPAKHLSKGPVHQGQLQGDEGQAHHAEHICHRQVQDVDVGHCLHFGITEDDVYDQSVATQPHGAHHEINEGNDNGAGLILV